MASTSTDSPHVQAKFVTSQKQYAVADAPFSVPANVGCAELNSLINGLLKPDATECEHVSFDFLINGEFVRASLAEHVELKEISTETVLEIEYVERHIAPEPEDALLHDDWVSAIHALNDNILTGCYDNTVKVWNTEGDQLISIPGHSGPVKCLSWIKNDEDNPVKTFVSGSHDETALLWQWNQQKNSVDCVYSCRGHARSVDCVATDPSRTRFCTGSWDKMLKIWSAVPGDTEPASSGESASKKKKIEGKAMTRTPLMTLSGHGEGVSSALWLSETEVCTASWDHSIRLWDIQEGTQKACLTGTKTFFDISHSKHSGLLLAASADRHVRLYDTRITDGAVVRATFTSHTAWVSAVAWSPTSEYQFISASYDTVVKLWDTRRPKAPLFNMTGHDDRILAVDWSMPQYMLSGGADNCLRIFRHMDRDMQGAHGVQEKV